MSRTAVVPTVLIALDTMVSESRVGAKIPSERVLSQQLGVSRMSVRKAVDHLVRDDIVERRHGSGVYIKQLRVASRMQMVSFTEEMKSRGLVAQNRVVSIGPTSLTKAQARALQVPIGSAAMEFTRIRGAGGEPIGVETVIVPEWTGFEFSTSILGGSLYEYLIRQYGVDVISAEVRVSVETPDSVVAGYLQREASQACLKINMVDMDSRGRKLMAVSCWYRPDRYHIELNTSRRFAGSAGEVLHG